MALAGVLAGAAEGDSLIDGAAVADLRRFADHNAHSVIDQDAAPYFCRRMYLNAGSFLGAFADPAG